jgi:hypothetical protein
MKNLCIAAMTIVLIVAASSAQAKVICHYELPGTLIGALNCFDYQNLRVRHDKSGKEVGSGAGRVNPKGQIDAKR